MKIPRKPCTAMFDYFVTLSHDNNFCMKHVYRTTIHNENSWNRLDLILITERRRPRQRLANCFVHFCLSILCSSRQSANVSPDQSCHPILSCFLPAIRPRRTVLFITKTTKTLVEKCKNQGRLSF